MTGYVEGNIAERYGSSDPQILQKIFLKNSSLLEKFIQEYFDELRDSVMGIPARRQWFRMFVERLLVLIPSMENWDVLDFPELRADILQLMRNPNFGKIHVGVCDIAYLSMVNAEGHSSGDDFLSAIGGMMRLREVYPELCFGRLGGDEIGAFHVDRTPRKLSKVFRSIQDELSHIEIEQNGHVFFGHIDIGYADTDEALKVFLSYIENILLSNSVLGFDANPSLLTQGSRISTFTNILMKVADRRAQINKVCDRLSLMVYLRHEKPKVYLSSISYLRKGSGNTCDRIIDQLVATRKNEGEEAFNRMIMLTALTSKVLKKTNILECLIENAAIEPYRRNM